MSEITQKNDAHYAKQERLRELRGTLYTAQSEPDPALSTILASEAFEEYAFDPRTQARLDVPINEAVNSERQRTLRSAGLPLGWPPPFSELAIATVRDVVVHGEEALRHDARCAQVLGLLRQHIARTLPGMPLYEQPEPLLAAKVANNLGRVGLHVPYPTIDEVPGFSTNAILPVSTFLMVGKEVVGETVYDRVTAAIAPFLETFRATQHKVIGRYTDQYIEPEEQM